MNDSEIDQAGEALVRMLHQSADVLEHNHRQALEEAKGIGDRVVAARDRIAELESELHSRRIREECS
jgi:hypothetical protein